MPTQYTDFIKSKVITIEPAGFSIEPEWLHESNKPHQRDIITWGCKGGQRAIFASFGLGKSQIQLEMARLCVKVNGGKALIICPLGVKQEFKKDAVRLGIAIEYVRDNEEVSACECDIMITNYERVRDGSIDVTQFVFVSLDEASAIRSLGSKTYITFNKIFGNVKYKYVATATPSPNEYIELLNYAAFLGIMDVSQAKTRFFKRDSTNADKLELYPHKEREFWLWVSSWAIFITKPSDLGYTDEGYDLPPLNIHYHLVSSDPSVLNVSRDGSLTMFKDAAVDLSAAAKEKRESIPARVAKASELIYDTDENIGKHWLVWHHLEAERKLLEITCKDIKTVFGAQKDEVKEDLLISFANGEYRILATKPEIAGQGCNFQKYCHSAIFLGVNYKFNDFIQAIHRIQRFQQQFACDIHIIYTEAEEHIVRSLQAKWKRHTEQLEIMHGIMKEYGLSQNKNAELLRKMGVDRIVINGKNFEAYLNDTVQESLLSEENSIDFGMTSVPFSIQYEYSPNYFDFGHNTSNEAFFEQMDYLVPLMLRELKPGRVYCVHVKDRIVPGNFSGMGFPTVYPFCDEVKRCFIKHGFAYMGKITIGTDVVRENKQTYRLGWSEKCKDGTCKSVGLPEEVLIMRKPPTDRSNGYADFPVKLSKKEYTRANWQIDANAIYRTDGNRLLTPAEYASLPLDKAMGNLKREFMTGPYNYERHVEIAQAMEDAGKLPSSFAAVEPHIDHPYIWTDVVRMRGLNTTQGQRKEQQHICPLPFDIPTRLIKIFTNKGERVKDHFAGLFTVPYVAMELGRIGIGVELDPVSFKTGVRYLKELEEKGKTITLFDLLQTA